MSLPSLSALRRARNRAWQRGDADVAEGLAIRLAARCLMEGDPQAHAKELEWLSRHRSVAGWPVVWAAAEAASGHTRRAQAVARRALKGDLAQITLQDVQRLVFLAHRGSEPPRLVVKAEDLDPTPADPRRAECLYLYGEAFALLGLTVDAVNGFLASANAAESAEDWPLARRALTRAAALREDPVVWARLAASCTQLKRATSARAAARRARSAARRSGGAETLHRVEAIIAGTNFAAALSSAMEAYLAHTNETE